MTNMSPRPAFMSKEALQELLDKHDLNQTDAAKRIGVNRRTLIRWLQGTTPIGAAAAALIHSKLG